jgi:hypothetical protein
MIMGAPKQVPASELDLAVRVIYECRTRLDEETENDAAIENLKTAVLRWKHLTPAMWRPRWGRPELTLVTNNTDGFSRAQKSQH